MESATTDLKAAAHQIVGLQYRNYVRQAIEAGLADAETGRVVDVAEVRKLVANLEQKAAKIAKEEKKI